MENVGVNKIFVYGGAAVNLMPHFMIRGIKMFNTNIKTHNMVFSNYEGKVVQTLGVIQVDLTIGSITRPTKFRVTQARSNYNLLISSEWIQGVGAFPSSLH